MNFRGRLTAGGRGTGRPCYADVIVASRCSHSPSFLPPSLSVFIYIYIHNFPFPLFLPFPRAFLPFSLISSSFSPFLSFLSSPLSGNRLSMVVGMKTWMGSKGGEHAFNFRINSRSPAALILLPETGGSVARIRRGKRHANFYAMIPLKREETR